jgi:hypothetical protein
MERMIIFIFFLTLLSTLLPTSVNGLYQGKFESQIWKFTDDYFSPDPTDMIRFIVALKLKNTEIMKKHFLEISNPHHSNYGKYLSPEELADQYGPSKEAKTRVKAFFEAIPGTTVEIAEFGDLMLITSSISEIEKCLSTKLAVVSHIHGLIEKRSLRSTTEILIPDEIAKHISFISLNSPVNHMKARGAKAVRQITSELAEGMLTGCFLFFRSLSFSLFLSLSLSFSLPFSAFSSDANSVYVTAGNEEAIIRFQAYCGDGSINNFNPPCGNMASEDVPLFQFDVYSYSNTAPLSSAYVLNTDPTEFIVPSRKAFCYNNRTSVACDGTGDAMNCYCAVKVRKIAFLCLFWWFYCCFVRLSL